MTLGRPSGAAWIGKPLDLTIPLELDRSEPSESLCLEADVMQGDLRLEDRRVTISLDPGPAPDSPRVRLRTTRAIEEPVVTVRLSAGCAAKSTRQYVLLADLPESPPVLLSPARPAATAGAGAPAAEPGQPARARPSRAARSDASRTGSASSNAAPASGAQPPPRRRAAAPTVQRPSNAPSAASPKLQQGGPRLEVEALSPEAITAPALQSSPAPAQGGAGSRAADQASAQSPAPVQPATTPTAEQVQREAERLKELESALATLREQSAQNQRLLLEMRGEVAQARESRYRNPLVYGLLALLALALIGLLLSWRTARRAQAQRWWSGAPEDGTPPAAARKGNLPRRGELADDGDDEDEDAGRKAGAASELRAAKGPRATPALPVASAFERAQVRSVSTEELFDVQQQAEFFLSLGKHEQAIGVLRDHIAANPGTSALAYLDLLGILHSQGRREDYAVQAREFEHRFNAEVPDFDNYSAQGRGLEQYQGVLARISAKWPSREALALIEELVFRKPGAREEVFDLPAYQELLLLYAVAHDVNAYEGPWQAPSPVAATQDPAPTPYLPSTADEAAPPEVRAPREMPPLELDLSELDRTAFETLRSPLEQPPPPPATPSTDPHLIDFDPFDPDTEAELRPRHLGVKR